MPSTISYGQEWLTVVNRAMMLLGKEPLDSMDDLTDPNANSRILIALPQAVSYVLSLHPWRGMTRRAVLSPLAHPEDLGDGERLFQLPDDCVRLVPDDSSADFRMVADRKLVSGSPTITVAYIHAPKVPEDMPPALCNLVASYLAYLLAQALTGSSELNNVASTIYQADLETALREDAAGDTRVRYDGDAWWTEAR